MPRNLVLCFDGTNSEFGGNNTNIVRLVQVLDRNPEAQRLYYDPGVGTLPEPGAWGALNKWLSKIAGLAFGAGLEWKVQEAYEYLMDFWEPGDKVFLFGFSRGAYTARVLAGMLHTLGLLPPGGHNLVPYVMRLFKAIRNERKHPEATGKPGDAERELTKWEELCDQFRWTFSRPTHENDDERRFRVHFAGLWDTVSSVGWVYDPVKFPYTARNPGIDIIRHAISVDERRWFFRQNRMYRTGAQDLKEFWFPGVHSDVGGGYSTGEGELWRISLEWILEEAQNAGLLVDQRRRLNVLPLRLAGSSPIWAGPKHESLTGWWWLAEFFPKFVWRQNPSPRFNGRSGPTNAQPQGEAEYSRTLAVGLGQYRHVETGALIHRSTLLRIRKLELAYAPPNFPKVFLERVRDGEVTVESLPLQG
jgi:uncharacterized protein (DUF2235 family)